MVWSTPAFLLHHHFCQLSLIEKKNLNQNKKYGKSKIEITVVNFTNILLAQLRQYSCAKKNYPILQAQKNFARNFCTKKVVHKMLVKLRPEEKTRWSMEAWQKQDPWGRCKRKSNSSLLPEIWGSAWRWQPRWSNPELRTRFLIRKKYNFLLC